ncbi:MAG: hypothetical protein AAFQ94_18220 [Bacteroidota bacterium]
MRYLFTFLFLITNILFSHAQDCKSGTILYHRFQDEVFLLLADHQDIANDSTHKTRGWSSFGGYCLTQEPEQDAAIRETHQETRGAYSIDYLKKRLSGDRVVEIDGFKTYLIEVESLPEDYLNNYPLSSDSVEYLERKPFKWIGFSTLKELVSTSETDTVYLFDSMSVTDVNTNYLFPSFVKTIDELSESDFQKEQPGIENDTTISDVLRRLETINLNLKNLEEIAKSEEQDPIGVISMLDSVVIYKSRKVGRRYFEDTIKVTFIKSVNLKIEDGGIKNAIVETNDGDYSYYGIDLLLSQLVPGRQGKYILRIPDRLQNRDGTYLYLKDAIEWIPNVEGEYYPDDNSLLLSHENGTLDTLKISTGLNSYLDIKVFTDLLAVLDDQENGLIQTDVSTRINFVPQFSYQIGFLKYLEFGFRLSRFDNDFQVVDLESSGTSGTIIETDLLELKRFSNVSLVGKINILESNQIKNIRYGVKYIFNYDFTNFSVDNQEPKTLNLYGNGTEAYLNIRHYKNFGFDLTYNFTSQKITNRNDLQNLNFLEDFDLFHSLDFLLYYNPLGDQAKRVY